MARTAARPHNTGSGAPPLPRLTSREIEVLVLVAQGLDDAAIAVQLHLAVSTVRTHIKRMGRKAATRSRAQLVSFAYESGHVVPARCDCTWGPGDGASRNRSPR